MFQKVFEYAGPHKKGLYAATAIVLVSVLMGVLPFVLAYQVIAPLVMGESIGASFIISRVALVLACLVLQARSQLKAIYKDNADTIVGNMDSQIFLGGSEPTTLKDLSEMLGKETIDAFNTSDTRGNSPSYGTTFQKMGHELLSRDELAVLDGGKCILQLRGVRPFLSDKYNLTQHPNYKLTSDYDPKNTFDIEKYLNRKEKINPNDEFVVIDADSLPPA